MLGVVLRGTAQHTQLLRDEGMCVWSTGTSHQSRLQSHDGWSHWTEKRKEITVQPIDQVGVKTREQVSREPEKAAATEHHAIGIHQGNGRAHA